MLLSIVALAVLPLLLNGSSKRFLLNSNFVYQRAIFFSFFIANSILLGWIGGQPIEEPMYSVGQYSSIFYFLLIFVIFPLINLFLALELSFNNNMVWWQSVIFFYIGLGIKPVYYVMALVYAWFESFRHALD